MGCTWSPLQGWATVAIAAFVAFITLNQWRVARAKVKLDLFEERYGVFLVLWTYLTHAPLGDEMTPEMRADQSRFRNATPKAFFLFGTEIGEYFEEVNAKGVALAQAMRRLHKMPPDAPGRKGAEAAANELHQWFSDALLGLRGRFAAHMDLGAWR